MPSETNIEIPQSLAELFAQWDDLDESLPEIEDEPMPINEEIVEICPEEKCSENL